MTKYSDAKSDAVKTPASRRSTTQRTMGRVYEFCGNHVVSVDRPGDLTPGPCEIVGKFKSATICATDISNMYGALGHGDLTGRIAGHESCYEVIMSNRQEIQIGQYVVPLGDDFFGLAERFAFKPVLQDDDIAQRDLYFDRRGAFLDPIEGHKAVLVLDEWFPGVSLVEPATHVYTSLLYNEVDQHESVLVVGGGLCGQIACHLMRSWDKSKRIILMEPDKERRDFALNSGVANDVLDPLHGSTEIQALIQETKGDYVNCVFDALPALAIECPIDSRLLAAKLVSPKGRWVLFGAVENVPFPLLPILSKGVTVQGSPFDSRVLAFSERADYMIQVLKLVQSKVLPVERFVHGSANFFDANDVLRLFTEPRSGKGLRVEVRA